jgi:phospholipid/cholesterol/gamma-HCH transport system substrate-binding protein
MMSQASNMMPQLSEIVKKVDTLVTSLNRVINDPKLALILSNVEQVTADLTKTTEHLNSIVGHDLPALAQTYNKVGENVLVITENFKSVDLQPTIASVNATIENVNAMVQQMHNPNGTLGALMYDRSLYNSLNKTMGSVDSLMTNIKSHPKRYVHFSVFGRKDK